VELYPSLQHGDIETPDLVSLGAYIQQLSAAGIQLVNDPVSVKFLVEASGIPTSEDMDLITVDPLLEATDAVMGDIEQDAGSQEEDESDESVA
jgi:hypothetical protein